MQKEKVIQDKTRQDKTRQVKKWKETTNKQTKKKRKEEKKEIDNVNYFYNNQNDKIFKLCPTSILWFIWKKNDY